MATDAHDLIFKPTKLSLGSNSTGDITLGQKQIRITISTATMHVVSISIESEILTNYLDTNANPNTPYTPQYPGSPATKKYVDDNIPTKVSDLTNDSDFQTATQVNQAISTAVSSAYKYKGSVANQAALPASGNTTGDVWNTEDTGMNYAWTGSALDALGAIVDLSGKQDKLIAGSNIQIASDGKTISATDTKYTAGTGISIDANNVISNTQTSAEWGNITGTLSDQTDLQNALDAKQDDMVILSYGNSTWNDFITAYQKNGVVYCRASSNSDPSTGSQGRLAFMAYVNNASNPTEVEFQYYRSRSSHSTAATVLDEVYVYKLVSTGGGTWSVTQRDTAAKPLAGTGIGFTYNASGMTISADTTTLATKTDLNSKQDTLVSGTNIKTVNNQSLLGSGNITISAPTYIAGENIQISSSNVISATNTEYNAGPGIEIGTIQDYSAMRGPCPEGFHVPLVTEWVGLKTIMTSLSLTTGDSWRINLHMPFAGYRHLNASRYTQGIHGIYWSSSTQSASSTSARGLDLDSSSVGIDYDSHPSAYGSSLRCFKDSYATPDSTWTVVQGILGSAGIFWSQSEGLISITDGTNGYTIMDKNLGATTIYNDGDTLTQANMGNMYQWGNNYGFPSTGTITNTSSTQVDTTGYGPTNPYSSDTFITGNGNWSSVQNDNLRGGETGVVTLNNAISNTGVLSVNGQTGNVIIPTGLQESPNSTITGIKYIRHGTEADYANLSQYYTDVPGDTEFHCF